MRTGCGLVSRRTPAENGLPGASRHCHRRLRGALFFSPSLLARTSPSVSPLLSLFPSLFSFGVQAGHNTRTRAHDRPATCTLYHFVIRFLPRDHDEARSGETPFAFGEARRGGLFGPRHEKRGHAPVVNRWPHRKLELKSIIPQIACNGK